jgi:hypothetical protein
MQTYPCALCGGPITVAMNFGNKLITVKTPKGSKAAHRRCADEENALPSEFGEDGDGPEEREW